MVEDGYIVIDTDDVDDDESGAVIESVKAASVELYAAECKATPNSPHFSTFAQRVADRRSACFPGGVRHGSTPAPSSEAEMLTSRSVTTAGIANSDQLSQTELKKLQDKRRKTKTEREAHGGYVIAGR